MERTSRTESLISPVNAPPSAYASVRGPSVSPGTTMTHVDALASVSVRAVDGGEPLAEDDVPLTESISDTVDRVRTLWTDELLPELLDGRCALVVGHANCLRALVRQASTPGQHAQPDIFARR